MQKKRILSLGLMAFGTLAVMAMLMPTSSAIWQNIQGNSTGNIFEPVQANAVIHCNPGDKIAFDVVSKPSSTNLSVAEMRAVAGGGCNGAYTINDELVLFDGDDDTVLPLSPVLGIQTLFWCDNITNPPGGDDPLYPESIQTMTFHSNDSDIEAKQMHFNWTEAYWVGSVGSHHSAAYYTTGSWATVLEFDADGDCSLTLPQSRQNSNDEKMIVAAITYQFDGVDTFNLSEMSVTKYTNCPVLTDNDAMFFATTLKEWTDDYYYDNFPYDSSELHPWKVTITQIDATHYRIETEVPINEISDTSYYGGFTNYQGDMCAAPRIDVGNVQALYPFPITPFLITGIVGFACCVVADKMANTKKDKASVVILVIVGVALIALCVYVAVQFYFCPTWPKVF